MSKAAEKLSILNKAGEVSISFCWIVAFASSLSVTFLSPSLLSKISFEIIMLLQTILVRLSQVKKISTSPTQRPTFISDSAYAKVHAALLEKFPDFKPNVEKVSSYALTLSLWFIDHDLH